MSDFQFYPTPLVLASKAWGMFKNKNFIRVLETSAGNGDMLLGSPRFGDRRSGPIPVDCCEIDMTKHATLRSLPGVSVVGMDYMQFGGGSIYSHIIQNPPFANGVSFVLKAWDGMVDGEIVSIINAETIRNPNSRERQHLLRLIEQHGEVKFIEDAFIGNDVERQTKVEIALVYLRKKSLIGEDIIGSVLKGLQGENERVKAERQADSYKESNDLAVPTTTIENFVLAFNAAVDSMNESVIAEAKAKHCSERVGGTMSDLSSGSAFISSADSSTAWVQKQIVNRYMDLKDRAWANLLRSSKVKSKLSSTAQKRMEAAFNEIKTLEFTVSNVCGFLHGLVENQSIIMRQMACDVFDLISRYHSNNVVFYKGWVSNSKQRTCGMRLKKARFVIPGNMNYSGSSSLSYEAEQRLADFDRVLAMLDGKDVPELSLVDVFRTRMANLKGGSRESTSYLDVRFYPGAGTIHFFPKSQDLMDKLNRLVGEYRQWLPPATETPSKDFKRQYDDAENFDKELREEVDAQFAEHRSTSRSSTSWDHPMKAIFREDEAERNTAILDAALSTVQERHGIAVDFQLQQDTSADQYEQLFLLAA